jgi:hypothetical protein
MSSGAASGGTEGAASSIDMISNAVSIADMDISHAGYIFQPGKFPYVYMPSLLHESAHWETFSTPVGNSLATLFLKASQRAQFINTGSVEPLVPAEEYEVVLDYARYRLATELLRPLSEGIALFTEFDLVPHESPVTTIPTILTSILFSGKLESMPDNATMAQISRFFLTASRENELFSSRKENLLCEPFSSENGGYLLGYYFIKNLRKLEKLLDGDLFLYCVKAVFFGDLEISRLLLDPNLDLMFSVSEEAVKKDALNALLNRIKDQFEYIIHDMDEAFIDKVENIVGSSEPWSWLDLQTNTTHDRLQENTSLIHEVYGQLTDETSYETDIGIASARTASRFIENRRLLCLAAFETEVTINEHRRCLVGSVSMNEMKVPVFSGPALDDCLAETGSGSYEIYLTSLDGSHYTLCYSVVLNDKCVACGSLNSDVEFDTEAFRARIPALGRSRARKAKLETELLTNISDDPIFEHYSPQIPDLVSEFYQRYCGAFVQLHGGDITKFYNSSFLDVPHLDTGFLAQYANLSLSTNGMFLWKNFDEICKNSGIEKEEFLLNVETWRSQYGIPLIKSYGSIATLTL